MYEIFFNLFYFNSLKTSVVDQQRIWNEMVSKELKTLRLTEEINADISPSYVVTEKPCHVTPQQILEKSLRGLFFSFFTFLLRERKNFRRIPN
jgi:hypothetical protein